MMNKVILTDCDGVLLDWEHSFDRWVQNRGFQKQTNEEYCIAATYGTSTHTADRMIEDFNQSLYFAKLTPLRDAYKYVRKFYEEHGVVFHCITSVGSDPMTAEARKANLDQVFGPGVFERVVCVGDGKREALSEYEGTFLPWIEDKVSNAELGHDLGLDSYLVHHDHNKSEQIRLMERGIRVVNGWRDIYNALA